MFKLFNKNVLGLIRNFNTKPYSERIKNEDIANKIKSIPDIKTFIQMNVINEETNINKDLDSLITSPSLIDESITNKKPKTFFIETHGCQMNENDTEIISTILMSNNLTKSEKLEDADVILTNTCAIRESAEDKVWNKIQHIKGIKRRDPEKIFGILGCMAERMKDKIFEKSKGVVDIIVGPDAYRDLPKMIDIIAKKDEKEGKFAMNVQLSLEETYADVLPVRKSGDNIRAYVSIMRGCNNMCSFCIVPFTRGRERSRIYSSIEDEVKMLRDLGVKEITLLGQNVNSYIDEKYADDDILLQPIHENSSGFKELFKLRNKSGLRFADLFDKLAEIAPEVRFRFTSPHPKDFPEKLIDVIKKNNNICKQIHLPAQSGSSKVLKNMRRYYTREAYLDLVQFIRNKMPYIALSSDFIAGFCEETEEDFEETLSLIEEVKYDMAFLFAYSMREKTHAYHNLNDNVSEELKKIRLNRMIDVFRRTQLEQNKLDIGKYHLVLVEGFDRRSNNKLVGRTDTNKLCIFENEKVSPYIPEYLKQKTILNSLDADINLNKVELKKGDYAIVRINDCSNNTLFSSGIAYVKSLKEFFEISQGKPYIEN